MSPRLAVALAALASVASACADSDGNGPPPDPFYDDFPGTWRTLVSTRSELGFPLTDAGVLENVVIGSTCTPDPRNAVASVSLVTLEWNDQAGIERFDLAANEAAFDQKYFTTGYPIVVGDRLLLPPDSAFFQDEYRMLQTGGGMFPRVHSFASTQLEAGLIANRIALLELSGGVAFTARVSRLENGQWTARHFTFTTPICPTSF